MSKVLGGKKPLRAEAEAQLAKAPPQGVPTRSDKELLHELQVHQIELEMQNEELRRMQIALEESRDRYVDLYELAPVGYLTLTDTGMIAEINITGAVLLGEERQRLIQRRFARFVSAGDSDRWRRLFSSLLQHGNKQSIELAMQHGDGSRFDAQLDCRRKRMEDGAQHVRIILFDITERKRMERKLLEQRNKMGELQQMQIAAQTAAAIAHELNQPLLAIATYSGAASMMLQADKPNLDKIRHAVEANEQQAHRAGESIRELLELLSIKEFPVDAFDLNQEILEVMASVRSEHEIQFHPNLLLEASLPSILANRMHVRKVLLNLLHNGIEAMLEAGVPSPSLTVTVRTTKNGDYAQVTIQDNGPGIEDKDFQRMFEPFFTTKTKGIGMGLSISRSLIELNGGQLWLEPQRGRGAVFHFTLPFAL